MIHLVTGSGGFIGTYLIGQLRTAYPKDTIYSVSLGSHPDVEGIKSFTCDLNDTAELRTILDEAKPDCIFHLAGFSRPSANPSIPVVFEQNFQSTVSLLEALSPLKKKVTVFFASTTHVYGNQNSRVDETSPVQPAAPYGFTKYLAEQALRQWVERESNLRVVVGRLYNCIGPKQGTGFIVSDLSARIRDLAQTGGKVLKTGPLDSRRTFMDVRDLVTLIPKLVLAPQPSSFEIYNLASPHSHTIREVVKAMVALSGRKLEISAEPQTAKNSFAGLDVSTDKLTSLLQPKFRPLQETLKDTLETELRKGSSS